jgi:hypothetical protein
MGEGQSDCEVNRTNEARTWMKFRMLERESKGNNWRERFDQELAALGRSTSHKPPALPEVDD